MRSRPHLDLVSVALVPVSTVDPPRTVVSVVGLLGDSGGALLTALLEYVREREGGPVAVDLRGVLHADRHGLAPVIATGAVLTGTSPAVDRVLAGGTRLAGNAVGHARPAGTLRSPGKEPRTAGTRPTGGPGSTPSATTTSHPTN
jgi:hypothetical protein